MTAKEYLDMLGFEFIKMTKDFNEECLKYTNQQQLLRINKSLREVSESSVRGEIGSNKMKRLYKLKNESPELSLFIANFFEFDHVTNVCNWLEERFNLLNGNVIDVGCDNGIITCFMALNRPDLMFTGIDSVKEATSVATELAKKLQLSNVQFITIDYAKIDNTYDTVCTFNFIHELHSLKLINSDSEEERITMYSHRLNKCASNISNMTAVGGRYISLEKYTFMDEIRAGYEKALRKYGFKTVESNTLEAYHDAPKGIVITEKMINEEFNQ